MIHLSFTPHHLPTFAILRPPLRLTATASNTTATINILHSFPSSSRLHFLYPPPCRPLRTPLSSFAPPTCAALRASAGDVLHDAGATALVLAGAYVLVFAFNNLTQRNLIHQKTGSHIIWVAFLGFLANFQNSNSNQARCFATLVPLVNCLRLVVHGFQLVDDDGLIKSVTREGNPKELLRGPLYYVLILIICALAFWRESPVGVISLAMMCGGDGIADIVGRKFGSKKIPYNPSKSWAGSISMFVFGFLVSIGMLYYYSALGFMVLDWPLTVQRVALVSMVATFVESLPITKVIDDNISVPLASMVTAFLSFGY
ncbi:probable phytol kinase 1, chloroplastic isoform X2 [Ziziphus jujuba]|uniref:phytol kinase n=1 Tax=Ziziphus jujuba TaxID=326968 RepID=A0ABM3IC54_ZIZJJ|nr:probable phytol kinase 1, chloroplastic isoform X2 [Ziziphus jujuba]